jgi:hypothetical protein
MNCCEPQTCPEDVHKTISICGGLSCRAQSHPVTLKTMLLMLKPDFFDQVGDSQYLFCASPTRRVVVQRMVRTISVRYLYGFAVISDF